MVQLNPKLTNYHKELYYSFSSYTYPSTTFKYDIENGESSVYRKPEIDFEPSNYVTEQVFYQSKDFTKIPMFITYKKGIERNGQNPTILYGYGGFNISQTPRFSATNIVWLENGGVYAVANLRGGGEYGEKWHLAGTKLNKQNVFDDFIFAGEFLIENGYTSNDYLAIRGGSNGGLLVGATMIQRPDLMKVAIPAVGVMDMLRYHQFTAGAGWAADYGTAGHSPEMFEYLRKYVRGLKHSSPISAFLFLEKSGNSGKKRSFFRFFIFGKKLKSIFKFFGLFSFLCLFFMQQRIFSSYFFNGI